MLSPPPSYFKYALKDQHNLVVLFGAACFSAAFASPIPLAVAAAGELFWLGVGPRLPRFRAWVDAQLNAQYLTRSEAAIEGALAELPEADVVRFRALSTGVNDVLALAKPRLPSSEIELAQHGLLELRRTFLDYLFLSQRAQALVDPTPHDELAQEAAQLQEAYAAERELNARMTIRKSLTAVQKRIAQQSGLGGVRKTIDLRLEMLEKAIGHLKTRLADPGFTQLSQELDAALAEVGAADALELTLDQIFETPAAA